SMMFRPRWPRAGPIGGEGFALPAGTCSLIKPTIFLAIDGSYIGLSGSAGSPSCDMLLRLLLVLPTAVASGETWAPPRRNPRLNFFDLAEFELHRRGTTEDRDRDAHLGLLVVDFLDVAVEVGERTILDADHLTHFVQHLRT